MPEGFLKHFLKYNIARLTSKCRSESERRQSVGCIHNKHQTKAQGLCWAILFPI
ncbi:MAG: hypothetical protein LBE79_07140 [Tannerella sp.]|nr:hypothetical protein [Tannerella sp.]